MVICTRCGDEIVVVLPAGKTLSPKVDICGRCMMNHLSDRGLLDENPRRRSTGRSTDRTRRRDRNKL